MSTDNTDLNALINQATSQVRGQTEHATRPPQRQGPSQIPLILASVVLAGALWLIYSAVAPPSSAVVQRDLEAVVDSAQQSVEAARKKNGELPDQLPNASLASVVRYEHGEKDYTLSATILGIRVTLAPGGQKKIETGVAQ